MPLYEYRCDECYTVFEQRRQMTDADEVAVCPACSSLLTTRVLGAFAVIGKKRSSTPPQQTKRRSHRVGCPCCVPAHSDMKRKKRRTRRP